MRTNEIEKRMAHFKSTFTTDQTIQRNTEMLFANDARFPFTILACLPWSFASCVVWDMLRPNTAFCVRCTQSRRWFCVHSLICMRTIRRILRWRDYYLLPNKVQFYFKDGKPRLLPLWCTNCSLMRVRLGFYVGRQFLSQWYRKMAVHLSFSSCLDNEEDVKMWKFPQ